MNFRYTGSEPRDIPALGITVAKGDEFEATGDVAKGLQGQELFERVTDKREK